MPIYMTGKSSRRINLVDIAKQTADFLRDLYEFWRENQNGMSLGCIT